MPPSSPPSPPLPPDATGSTAAPVLRLAPRAHDAVLGWRARAAEAGAAAVLVASPGTSGLSPEAATSVARALASLRGGTEGLAGAVARHADALDATLTDLAATDQEVAAVVDRLAPVLPTAGGW